MLRIYFLVFLGFFLFIGSLFGQNCSNVAGFTQIGVLDGHEYFLAENNLTWEEANEFAQQNGGYLLAINSQNENEFVRQRIGNNMVFIGFNDKGQEGNPIWSNGTQNTIDLSSNNSDSNDFAVMNFWNGHWEFGNKWEQRKFVMEIDCGTSTPPTNSSPVQVFILAGQSNMSGGGVSSELNPDLKIVPPNATLSIHFYGSEYSDFGAGNFGPEVSFIQEITQANPAQKYLFIKYAWGGTGINQWLPGTHHYQTLIDKINQALSSLNSDYDLASFLWMQGETDAFSPDDSELYAQRLNTVITSLRNELGELSLPILIGQIDPPNACCVPAVQAAESDFVSNDTQARLVLTDGLSRHWNDPIHYNTAGQIDLGHRFFASFQTLAPKDFQLRCPENLVKVLSQGDENVKINWGLENVFSSCATSSDVHISQIEGRSSGSEFESGNFNVSYAAYDDCQNNDTCSFNITVKAYSACPSTVEDFVKLGSYEGHSYFLSENNLAWMEAQVFSAEHGGYLATINTIDENNFLKGTLNNNMVFIGLNDQSDEGVLNWSNGAAVDIDLSYDNSNENDFAVMSFWAGTWQMVNKWVAKPFIMEMDCENMDLGKPKSENKPFVSPIYPNPASSFISFDFETKIDKEIKFNIFSESGYLYLSEKRNLEKGSSNVQINIRNLPKGKYSIRSNIHQQLIHFIKY